MKYIFSLLTIVCFAGMLQAQVAVDDFESGNKGWDGIEGTYDIRANAYKSGINLSNTVLYTQRSVGANNWAGAILNGYTQTGYKYVHAYMYRNNTNVPNLKIFDSETPVEFVPMNTIVANQWQDVVFDISAYAGRGTDFLFFMVDRTNISSEAWMLIDEIQLSNDATPRTAVVGGSSSGSGDSGSGDPEVVDPSGVWTLKWQDNFNGAALDRDLWNIEVNGDGGGNGELQYYCEKGVTVQNGNLALTATKENYMGKGCTSGRINTKQKVYFTYGKIEARIKMPRTANGLWPAFWMLGNDIDQVSWPDCGEIDIVEMGNQGAFSSGTQERYLNGACHWGPWANGGHPNYGPSTTYSYSLQDDYHLFTCIWNSQKVAMYVDLDKYPSASPYFEMAITDRSSVNSPGNYFHKPNFIILNLAVGGAFPGIWDVNGVTALSSGSRSMLVDYVRIWQKGDAGETFYSPKSTISTGEEQTLEEININRFTKVMRNGTIYILRNGHMYDMNGRLIR